MAHNKMQFSLNAVFDPIVGNRNSKLIVYFGRHSKPNMADHTKWWPSYF